MYHSDSSDIFFYCTCFSEDGVQISELTLKLKIFTGDSVRLGKVCPALLKLMSVCRAQLGI